MIEPIVLTKYGETLWVNREYEYEAGEKLLLNKTGVHAICIGWVDIHHISVTHKALVCRKCAMRVLVPESVETYGDLRSYINTQNSGVLPGP